MFSSFPKKTHEIKSELSESIKTLSDGSSPGLDCRRDPSCNLAGANHGQGCRTFNQSQHSNGKLFCIQDWGSKKESIAHTRQTNPVENGSSPESSDGRSEGPALASAR